MARGAGEGEKDSQTLTEGRLCLSFVWVVWPTLTSGVCGECGGCVGALGAYKERQPERHIGRPACRSFGQLQYSKSRARCQGAVTITMAPQVLIGGRNVHGGVPIDARSGV